MTKYKIRAYYSTGNSFGSHDETETLDFEWDSLELAKENLQRLTEHYKYYVELNKYTNKTKKEISDSVKDKDWFNNEKYYETSLYLLNNKREKFLFSTGMYCGYFESLHSLEIVINDDDLIVEF